jgi:hypothetical protein
MATAQDQLADYVGPKGGQTYVYSVTSDNDASATKTTLAGVTLTNNELVTCSPASVADYPEEIRKLNPRPILSRIVVRGDAITSTRGKATTTLLKEPLAVSGATWTNRQIATVPSGVRDVTVLTCGVSSVGTRDVLGVERKTVTVECTGGEANRRFNQLVTYAKDVGPIEDDTEVLTNDGKSAGMLKRTLTTIRDGAEECMRLAMHAESVKAPK